MLADHVGGRHRRADAEVLGLAVLGHCAAQPLHLGVDAAVLPQGFGAAPIPKHHFRMFGMAANETPFDQVFGVRSMGWWGMTETVSQGIIGDALLRNRSMTTGRPAPGYGIRILHPDRTPVAPGETGHLECWGWRGIQLFLEYLNNPQATAESFTPDGWFMTGDRVRWRPTATSLFPTATRTC